MLLDLFLLKSQLLTTCVQLLSELRTIFFYLRNTVYRITDILPSFRFESFAKDFFIDFPCIEVGTNLSSIELYWSDERFYFDPWIHCESDPDE